MCIEEVKKEIVNNLDPYEVVKKEGTKKNEDENEFESRHDEVKTGEETEELEARKRTENEGIKKKENITEDSNEEEEDKKEERIKTIKKIFIDNIGMKNEKEKE